MNIKPVIFGGDILAYSYARCMHEAYGVRSLVICSNDVKMVTSSKFLDAIVDHGIEDTAYLLGLAKKTVAQVAAAGDVPVLLGSGDWYARFLCEYQDELTAACGEDARCVVPYLPLEKFESIMHKDEFYAACDRAGVDRPLTFELDMSTATELPSDEELGLGGYPVICKPSDSAAWHYAEFPGKEKVAEIADRAGLEKMFEAIKGSSYKGGLLLQDRIPGDDTVIYSITVFCDRGDVRIICVGHVLLQDHDPSALGNPVCIMSTVDEPCHQHLIDAATRLVKEFDYHGYGNFDVMYDARSDTYRFLEMNARPGRNSYYLTLAGENFVKPIVEQFVEGKTVAKRDLDRPFLFKVVPTKLV
ncbi:carboxylate--amine ligase, partial [Slackia exigua]